MAWFQNLAGRAEDILNKIDQNAATVLNDGSSKLSDRDSGKKSPQELVEDTLQIENVNENLKVATKVSQSDEVEPPKSSYKDDGFIVNVSSQNNFSVADVYEKSSRSDSISSHNSFTVDEDVQNYTEKINSLEIAIQDLNKQLLNLQHLYAELRNENTNLRSQVESSNHLVKTAQSEMEQYKARAQRILQEKQDLILLKNQSKSLENTDYILTNYNDELKKELEFQQDKNLELSEKLKKQKQEITLLQQQIVLNQNACQQSNQSLEEELMTEKKIRMIAEEECQLKSHELQLKTQELSQQYHVVELKGEEISRLQEALKRQTDFNVDGDSEIRIKSLTETLMLKQNALEAVTTERNALRIQQEKLENEYHNSLAQLQRAQVRVINVNDTDDAKSQVPHFMRVSPFDAGVTRRVKHAYSTVDAISIRTGIFLRRYPFARVFVFCYMVLLHLWALLILFLYVPSSP